MNRNGLKKVTKAVRGKRGTVRRSYWVRAKESSKGLLRSYGKSAAKGLGAVALTAGAALLAHRHGTAARKEFASFRRGTGSQLAGKLVSAVGERVVSHVGERAGRRAGAYIGKKVAGRRGRAMGAMIGETVGGVTASHLTEQHIDRASKYAAKRVRESGYRRRQGRYSKD